MATQQSINLKILYNGEDLTEQRCSKRNQGGRSAGE